MKNICKIPFLVFENYTNFYNSFGLPLPLPLNKNHVLQLLYLLIENNYYDKYVHIIYRPLVKRS